MAIAVPPKIDIDKSPRENIIAAGMSLRADLIAEAEEDLAAVAERALERQMKFYRIIEAVIRHQFGPWDD